MDPDKVQMKLEQIAEEAWDELEAALAPVFKKWKRDQLWRQLIQPICYAIEDAIDKAIAEMDVYGYFDEE